jgi:hypothetical protein
VPKSVRAKFRVSPEPDLSAIDPRSVEAERASVVA